MKQRSKALGNDPFLRGAGSRLGDDPSAPRDDGGKAESGGATGRTSERKTAARKTGQRKTPARRTGERKTAARRTGERKTAASKTGERKTAARRTGETKTAARKTGQRKTAARKAGANAAEHRRRMTREERAAPLEAQRAHCRQLVAHEIERTDEFGLDTEIETSCRPIFEAIYTRWFRVEARGLEHIPRNGPALLVCNHGGALPWDALMVKTAAQRSQAGRRVRPLIEDFIFHFPFMGPFLNRCGAVRACQDNARRLLDQGALLAVFPEGLLGLGKPYRHRYHLLRFGRGGFVKLALRSGVPIVPVSIVGSEDAHPILANLSFLAIHLGLPYLPITPTFPLLGPLGLLPLPAKWIIELGEPIDLSDYGPEAATDRVLVRRLSDEVRSRIQSRVNELRTQRRGVF